jgi:Uma2 family endonuclease
MEMATPETILQAREPIRPLKRVEFERLGAEGFFDDERVELLFGMVVPMTPIDPPHEESVYRIRTKLERGVGERARVRQGAFAASEISEPIPDVLVVPPGEYWHAHPSRAFLVVEVSRSSLRKDSGLKATLYGSADVDEYWIIDHAHGVVVVHRDHRDGEWMTKSTHARGETIAMLAFPDVAIAVSEILPPVG